MDSPVSMDYASDEERSPEDKQQDMLDAYAAQMEDEDENWVTDLDSVIVDHEEEVSL